MAKMKFDARELMELAVRVMGESIAERRSDGKASPLVGAVLWRPDGSITTACRGELREGDHAEFTVLERKHRDTCVDDGVLFATLEPCAPGARKEPKKSCAERIVLARIKQVYVGIEDPDPTVDRKGIKYLQDNGVDVQMFDRDLQEQICETNRAFIDQAVERAMAAGQNGKPVEVTLSPLENPIRELAIEDFAPEMLEQFRRALGVKERIASDAFSRRLLMQGLVKEDGHRLRPTGSGALLFGRSPRDVMPQAGVLATIHYPGGLEETRDFDGPLVGVPRDLEKWLRDKLPNTIDRSHMERREMPAVPFEVIREGIVNALVHRDYRIQGAKCQLVVTPDAIIIMSPGKPVRPITIDQLNQFSAPMLSRNPPLHYVFAKMDLAEERGLGMKTLSAVPKQAGLPAPRYSMDDPYLVLTIPRSAAGAAPADRIGELRPDELRGWDYVVKRDRVSSKEYADALKVDQRTAKRHLRRLVDLGFLRMVGAGPSTRYERI